MASIQKETKVIDAELAQIQALIHDPVAPLIRLLHACDDDGSSLSMEDARAAVADAIRLLGNASAAMSRLRRKRILKSVNPDIVDLAEEDIFQSVAPNLFGSGFEAKMKEGAESVELLSASRSGPPQPRKFFQRGRPMHCPPERRWPVQQRKDLAKEGTETLSQEVNQCVKERLSIPFKWLYKSINNYIGSEGGNSTRSGQSSNSRKASIFQGQLVQSVTGPMDPGHNKGIQNRICNSTHSGKTAQSWHVINLGTNVTGGGDGKVANQGGSHRGSPRKEASGFLLQPLPRPHEKWGHETGNQSEGSTLTFPPPFQDGGPSHIEGPPEGGELDDKGRSEGCILHDTNPTARQAVPKFFLRKPRLPVHMPAIRPVLCSVVCVELVWRGAMGV